MHRRGSNKKTMTWAGLAGLSLIATACSGGSSEGDSLTILQYEDPESAQGQGWQLALEIFQERHPDVEVDFQQTSFDAMRQNARITLSGSDVPDVVEFNKGNADGGQLAAQGLLEPITEVVEERGWDQIITGSMAAFARYENGLAGAGDWYGIPNIGEYVTFYYNQEVFDEVGIAEPQSIEELETAFETLLDAGHTPVSSSAASSQGFNQMWVWYSLVSAHAERDEVDDFMFLQDEVDFSSDPWAVGSNTFEEWTRAGYMGEDISGLNYEQAIVNFLSGDAAMLLWNQGAFDRVRNDADFEWGYFTFPGANHVMGSSGHLWGVPADAQNKDLAYEWIEITLSPEVQNRIGDLGGLPIAGDPSAIEDELTREYTERFYELMDADALSFYPDYPVPGFLDFIQGQMQAVSNGNQTSEGYLHELQSFYDEGRRAELD